MATTEHTKTGATSICRMCNQKIEYSGKYWQHVDSSPRHPAQPTRINNTPEQTTTEHATNEQMALVMGWRLARGFYYLPDRRYAGYRQFQEVPVLLSTPREGVQFWNPIADLNHTALVEARLIELDLGHAYATYLYQIGQFRHIYQFVSASAQTRCDAAWATWQAWQQREKE